MMTNLFPAVQLLKHSADLVELQLEISADISYFTGHFPQHPVLAGVTQLHWAVHYCQQYYPQFNDVVSTEVLKFQQVIAPESQLILRLERIAPATSLFSYLLDNHKVSSGRLKWSLLDA
jgi:3-hydroxymyristoyl/3-hydroxydecanoyl-(acyl carrier protein) dehydratase